MLSDGDPRTSVFKAVISKPRCGTPRKINDRTGSSSSSRVASTTTWTMYENMTNIEDGGRAVTSVSKKRSAYVYMV